MDNNIESSFDAIPFYQKHPYMKPFIGERFDSELHKKLLIVGESHYLPATSTVHLNIDDWYAGNCDVSDEEKEWCNTRNSRKYGYGKIFQQLSVFCIFAPKVIGYGYLQTQNSRRCPCEKTSR